MTGTNVLCCLSLDVVAGPLLTLTLLPRALAASWSPPSMRPPGPSVVRASGAQPLVSVAIVCIIVGVGTALHWSLGWGEVACLVFLATLVFWPRKYVGAW